MRLYTRASSELTRRARNFPRERHRLHDSTAYNATAPRGHHRWTVFAGNCHRLSPGLKAQTQREPVPSRVWGCCVSHTQTSLAVRFIISPMSPPRHNATGAHTRHVHHPYMLPHHVGPCDTKRKLRASDGRRILPVSESLPSSYQVLVGTSSCSSTGYPKWLSTWYRSSTSDWVSGFVLSTMQSSGCFSCQSFGLI